MLLVAAIVLALPGRSGSRIMVKDRPVNFAHRGASASVPENKFAAFDEALAARADALELDVRLLREGRLVVIHDEYVDRTTSGSGRVRDASLAGLRDLLGVPTLEETLRRYPGTFVNVEIKSNELAAAERVFEDVTKARASDRVLVVSEDREVTRRFREFSEGRVATGASCSEVRAFYLLSRLRLERMLDPAYDSLQVPAEYKGFRLATPR